MKPARWWALTGALGLSVPFLAALAGPAAAATAPAPTRSPLHGSLAPAAARSHPAGSVAGTSTVGFDLVLSLRNAAAAQAFVRSVSTPGSAEYHHFLSDAAWQVKFGPSAAEVTAAETWLRQEGFSVGSVPKDRLFVPASGTAAKVESAFGVKLGYYTVHGHKVRLAKNTLSVPTSLAASVSGVVGVNQYLASTGLALAGHAPAGSSTQPSQEPPPPAGFRNPQPCSKFWGQKIDSKDSPSLYAPYTPGRPYDICGYKPAQLRGAYNLARSVAGGNNGKGVTVAIVDAYDSPTLLSDAQEYSRLNDPANPLTASQFVNVEPATVDDQTQCGGSGWFAEQALDVESSHAMAPGATIEYVGAQDCQNPSLLAAVNTAVTSGASVVSNSWGDGVGDVLADAATKTAFDNTFMLADSTGVGVLFSSGDSGDNFADFGIDAPDYPASSPFVTAVGGTTLEVNSANARAAEFGWSTAKQVLCAATTTSCSGTTPAGSLAWQAGGGGGTSYTYSQPSYQAGVVPSALAHRNQAVTGPTPMRVLPDISMDADAQSGMLIGLTQTFPDGTYYDQFKEGGTSLASPLMAGVVADADQAAGSPLGFLNPILYKASTATPAAFNDVVAPADPHSTAVLRVDYADAVDAAKGYLVSLRVIDYEGPETFCDATGNCATRNVTLTPAPGFDSLTGIGSIGRKFIATMSKF